MADFDDWDSDGGAIQGGLLDSTTFPARRAPPETDSPAIDRPAPEITGPLMTDPHAEVLQDILNAQARLPPVRPHPETWLINGQPYLAIEAGNFDPTRSSGVTSMPTPADSAAAMAGVAQVEVPLGIAERGGYIADNPSRVVVAYGKPGGSDNADTLTFGVPQGSPPIHGHIDRRRPDPSDPFGPPEKPPGMVDRPDANDGFGDTQSLSFQPPAPTATVSNGQVGWHVLQDGQLKFLYPPGSMTPAQIQEMRRNLDQEQWKFLRPR